MMAFFAVVCVCNEMSFLESENVFIEKWLETTCQGKTLDGRRLLNWKDFLNIAEGMSDRNVPDFCPIWKKGEILTEQYPLLKQSEWVTVSDR